MIGELFPDNLDKTLMPEHLIMNGQITITGDKGLYHIVPIREGNKIILRIYHEQDGVVRDYLGSAYDWWYMMFLPTCVALLCITLTGPEKRMQFFNVAILPVQKGKQWLAKIITGFCYILAGNLIVFGLTTASGLFFGSQYPVWRGITAAFVLTVTWAWQIPVGMLLSTKFNSVVTFLGILGVNVIFSIQDIAGGSLWYIPFAIPARLMAPILGINPNGAPMAPDSPLHDASVILSGLLITAALFAASLLLTKKWFNGRSE